MKINNHCSSVLRLRLNRNALDSMPFIPLSELYHSVEDLFLFECGGHFVKKTRRLELWNYCNCLGVLLVVCS